MMSLAHVTTGGHGRAVPGGLGTREQVLSREYWAQCRGYGRAVPEMLYVPANIALALDETHSGRTGPDLGRAGPTFNHSFRTASHQAQKNWP